MSPSRSPLVPLVVLVATLVATGCGRTMQPRTSRQLDPSTWLQGAVLDASDAYPIAFWADPCRPPAEHEVGSDTIRTQTWLCHFARQLNATVAKRGLYDARFASAGKDVLGGRIEAGLHEYPCEPDAVDRLKREAVRLARIELVKAETTTLRETTAVRFRIAVIVGTQRLEYETNSSVVSWDVDVFQRLGTMILSDTRFWAAVKMAL